MKKVSVVIPAYNKAELTIKTVESVLNQTYKNIEIIVVDDGSTDDTKSRLDPYADRIKYVFKKNGGACSARNLGIKLASGEYVGLLDCDDLYTTKKIELCVDYLEKHSDCGFVHTAAYFIDENDTILRFFSHYQSRHTGWIAKRLLQRNFICNSTIVARKLCFEKAGYFDETIFTPADWDMWLRLAENYKAGYINLPLTKYRISGSYILDHIEQYKTEELMVLEKAFKRSQALSLTFKNRAISNVHRRCAISYLLISKFEQARNEFIQSIHKNKFNLTSIILYIYFTIAKRHLSFVIKNKVFYNFGI